MKQVIAILTALIVFLGIGIIETTSIIDEPSTEEVIVEYENHDVSEESEKEVITEKDCEPVYELWGEEFDYCCKIVATEAGNQSYEGKLAVAQTIKNRMETRHQSIMKVMKAPNQYAYNSSVAVDNETIKAVEDCFWRDKDATSEIITHFFAYNLISTPDWATEDCYVTTIGDHKFYGRG